MKVLFIGGTGIISTEVSAAALAQGVELWHLNRGQSPAALPLPGLRTLVADSREEATCAALLAGHTWDVVVNWVAFTPEDAARDVRRFAGKVGQYVFISSATVYRRPVPGVIIREDSPRHEPDWDYARRKKQMEDFYLRAYAEEGFPVTIVRPSHTYSRQWPIAVGPARDFTIPARIRRGQPVIVHGDGTSLWTMTHSADFAQGFLPLLGHPKARGEAFHLTSDFVYDWNTIYRMMGEALGRETIIVHRTTDELVRAKPNLAGPLRYDKGQTTVFDNAKLRGLARDFAPRIDLKEGLARLVAYYDAHPELQTETAEMGTWMDTRTKTEE